MKRNFFDCYSTCELLQFGNYLVSGEHRRSPCDGGILGKAELAGQGGRFAHPA